MYSSFFWLWPFSRCSAALNEPLNTLWGIFTSETNYLRWYKSVSHSSELYLDHGFTRPVEPYKDSGSHWHKLRHFKSYVTGDPLFSACLFGSNHQFKALLKTHTDTADLNALLCRAACPFGKPEFAGQLIDSGADVSAVDQAGNTALHWATDCGHQALSRLLIEKGADVSAAGMDGETPLHIAIWQVNEAMARLRIEKGADVSAADMDGETPLHIALENGSKVVATNRQQISTSKANELMARLLIEKGADVLRL